ncbi:MAG: M15 family metallopeptidase [Actinomycetota bacterium]
MTGRRSRLWTIVAAAGVAGLVVGATGSLAVQSTGTAPDDPSSRAVTSPESDTHPGITVPAAPKRATKTSPLPASLFFAWTSGGLPGGFETGVRDIRRIDAVAVVRSDTTWMARSFDADGKLVDDPRAPFDIPLEASAVDPADFGAFLPVAYKPVVARLEAGEGVISESSARVRGIGVGGTIEMRPYEEHTGPSSTGQIPVRIAAVLPDDLVGATELMVAEDVGMRIGAIQERYALLDPKGSPSVPTIERAIRPVVGSSAALLVREFGDTLYPRHGDAVLPPVMFKLEFGEFAARPLPGAPGSLDIDGRWSKEHIEQRRLPIVGNIQCHEDVFPQLIGVLEELQRRGLQDLIRTEHGCFVPKFMLNVANSAISHHSWGVAVDLNLAGNEFGTTPHQPTALVRIMEKWGFTWGGRWITPDGNHFEWHDDVDPTENG